MDTTLGGPAKIGLIGTITRDRIVHEAGPTFEGIGGILYQASVLAGLGEEVFLCGQCGEDLRPDVDLLAADWPSVRTRRTRFVPQPANLVNLFYPVSGERVETLDWAVPPADPGPVLAEVLLWDALLFVLNSGFDLTLDGWRKVLTAAACPAWLDIHSLVLEPAIGRPRRYRAVPDWPGWVRGVAWLQANLQEVACLCGHPERLPTEPEVLEFANRAFDLGVRAAFITLGPGGAMALTPGRREKVAAAPVGPVVDATGCGDVFAAAALTRLVRGASPSEAASFGTTLASEAALLAGVRATWKMAAAHRQGRRPGPQIPPSAREER
jgi:sugar/nucleoside kinase (ribokinase family)